MAIPHNNLTVAQRSVVSHSRMVRVKTGCKIFLASLVLASLAGGVYFALPAPQRIYEIRERASPYLRAVDAGEYAPYMENESSLSGFRSMRAPASRHLLHSSLVAAMNFASHSHDMGQRQAPLAGGKPVLAPMLKQDGSSQPILYASLPGDYADLPDESGQPLRWLKTRRLSYASLHSRQTESAPASAPRVRAQPVHRQAGDYRPLVESFANRFDLNAALVMAIIHSESNFSPHLVSSKSAMGLMQLLPSTASDEVHRFLYGKRGDVSYAELSQPETNIRYGTAYLHILHNRYFPNVRDRDVREACVVASYNLGPNRFLRLYGANNESAVEAINALSREEFFEDLFKRLPSRETRFYVEKVRRMKSRYSSLN